LFRMYDSPPDRTARLADSWDCVNDEARARRDNFRGYPQLGDLGKEGMP
jgi:hypothetical protein